MSKVKLTGESSGYVEISAGTAAGNNTLELPTSGNKIISNNYVGVVTASTFSGDFSGDVTVATGATISGSTDTIIASTNGSERLRINSDGDVVVRGPSNPQDYTLSNGIYVQPGNGSSGLTIASGSATDNAYINFPKGTASHTEQFAFAIGRDGTNNQGVVLVDNAVAARFGSTGIVMPSGKGIDFSASGIEASGTITSTNQLLDDYEEGLWTPTLIGSTSGSASGYSHQKAGYVKIGNVVHVYGYLLISNKGTITGNVRISNFPFATKNTGLYYHAPAFGWYTNMTGITAYGLGIDMAPGQTSHTIIYGSGTTVASLAAGNINNNFGVEWAFTYRTD